MTGKDKLIAFVRETSRLAGEAGIVERRKASAGVSEATRSAYARVGARRLDLRKADLGELMQGVSARSWHTTRAALLHQTAEAFALARRSCDAAQRQGDVDQAAKAAALARRAILAFQQVQAAERPGETTARRTKRKTLPRTDDWQARIYEAATPTQRPAIAVLWAVGCRPAELEMGVDIVRRTRPDGRVLFELRIPGAKVTERSGQPTRRLAIDGRAPVGQVLAELMGDRDELTVQRGAKRLNADFADIRSKVGLRVSPYSMRHQAAANLKSQMGPEQANKVAEALGHVTTRSQGRYGSVRQAQAGGSGVVGVKAVREVRETRPARRPRSASEPTF